MGKTGSSGGHVRGFGWGGAWEGEGGEKFGKSWGEEWGPKLGAGGLCKIELYTHHSGDPKSKFQHMYSCNCTVFNAARKSKNWLRGPEHNEYTCI